MTPSAPRACLDASRRRPGCRLPAAGGGRLPAEGRAAAGGGGGSAPGCRLARLATHWSVRVRVWVWGAPPPPPPPPVPPGL